MAILLAEGVGFEPTELSLNGFQDRRLKPLGHPSGNVDKTQERDYLSRQYNTPKGISQNLLI
jgi:hypothetical protein